MRPDLANGARIPRVMQPIESLKENAPVTQPIPEGLGARFVSGGEVDGARPTAIAGGGEEGLGKGLRAQERRGWRGLVSEAASLAPKGSAGPEENFQLSRKSEPLILAA